MKGPARSWALPYLETIRAGGDPFPTYADFEITFNRRFAPLDSTQVARDVLKSIKQGKRLWSICPTSINTSNRQDGLLRTTVNTFTMVLMTTSKTYYPSPTRPLQPLMSCDRLLKVSTPMFISEMLRKRESHGSPPHILKHQPVILMLWRLMPPSKGLVRRRVGTSRNS